MFHGYIIDESENHISVIIEKVGFFERLFKRNRRTFRKVSGAIEYFHDKYRNQTPVLYISTPTRKLSYRTLA